ncbi:MAG: N-acetyltransferase [Clostridiales bacterium]|nr:N-acetyltransferase [Clostridiales bacterium]
MEFQFSEGRVYALNEQQEVIAEAIYVPVRGTIIDICHTYVSPALRGQGIAGQLMQATVDELRRKNLKAVASCSYAELWLNRNRTACTDIIA